MFVNYFVYQLKDPAKVPYAFREYKYALENGFVYEDYEEVYNGNIEVKEKYPLTDSLEEIYAYLNLNHPEDYKGRSLSVSDIVKLDFNADEMFYCDTFGWKKLSK